jgi:hypothetical protein
MLVRHATLGLGKVVAVEPTAVHVFFPGGDGRFAAKLRLPGALGLLRTDGIAPDARLEGLTAFTLDPKAGRYALAAGWMTHDEAVAQFLARFPGGFSDPANVAGKQARVARWRAAHDRWAEVFGEGQGARLLAAGEVEELVARALKVDRTLGVLHPAVDADAVRLALEDEGPAQSFLAALLELLSVPSPARARFEKLFAAARELPVEAAQQWLVATLFAFVASPGRQVLVRPKITFEAAERLGADVGPTGAPTWPAYEAVRTLCGQLLEELRCHGATDFVDVEWFLHVTATAKRRARSAG